MNAVLAQTLVWTGVLIAAVLLLRRPVARHFGPQVAYALWALPLARLLLPPITLPAWMKPSVLPLPEPDAVPLPDDAALVWEGAAALPPTAAELPHAAAFDPVALLSDLPLFEALLLVWLGGAAVFLWRRFAAYFDLRDELLSVGCEMGRLHTRLRTIRLVETPATAAPLALGVLDPVIALPPGFMALDDRQARDLALAHEMAHHHGGDLLVNVLVQPLFALHWWNPLSGYGWLALRRDQEAACDARVMARRDAAERAAYATLIARYAAVPGAAGVLGGAALTAPMACPVLGEKSIIHRLRSLSMSDLSPRRRMAGRALLGAGLLILPLTASISYAASEAAMNAPQPPEPPAPPAPPAPPVPPTAPDAPQPPAPPVPPAPPEAPKPPKPLMAFLFDGTDGSGDGEHKVIVSERTERGEGGERTVRIVRRLGADGQALSKAEREEMVAELREGLAEADRELADLPRVIALAMAEAEGASATARANAPKVIMMKKCDGVGGEPAETVTSKDGKQTILICKSRIHASARSGLEQARDEIARDKGIPEDTRKQVLETLDRQIARWAEQEG